jgi:two-component system cell cycle response regulator DivK
MAKTILIVEDNDQNRLLIKDVLTYHGFAVLEAANGEEGVRLARERLPDLIFMDLQMPVLDGYAAIAALKADPATRTIIIIALTSYAMKGDREKALAAGADGYLAKPLDTRALPGTVRKFLGEKG